MHDIGDTKAMEAGLIKTLALFELLDVGAAQERDLAAQSVGVFDALELHGTFQRELSFHGIKHLDDPDLVFAGPQSVDDLQDRLGAAEKVRDQEYERAARQAAGGQPQRAAQIRLAPRLKPRQERIDEL